MKYFKEISKEEFNDDKFNSDFMQLNYRLRNRNPLCIEDEEPSDNLQTDTRFTECQILFVRTNEEEPTNEQN